MEIINLRLKEDLKMIQLEEISDVDVEKDTLVIPLFTLILNKSIMDKHHQVPTQVNNLQEEVEVDQERQSLASLVEFFKLSTISIKTKKTICKMENS